MEILQTLQALNACHAPSGDESQIASTIRTLVAPYADEITTDAMGNLIVRKKGSGAKIMFAAHMDSIGLIVTHISEKGFLYFGNLGGVSPHNILHTPVRFKNGVRGIVSLNAGKSVKEMTLSDMYIDIGAKDEAEAKKMVEVGDTAVYDAPAFMAGSRIVSPYMDNRISCVILLMALEQLKETDNDLYFTFTVQEEVGLRGAKPAAYAIDPDYGIAVDVTASDDLPGSKHGASSSFGGGAAIKVMDRSIICHPEVVTWLETLAKEKGIKAQRDIILAGGTDAGAIHQTRGGVPSSGISIPCRYIHSPVEMVDIADVEACIALVVAMAEDNKG